MKTLVTVLLAAFVSQAHAQQVSSVSSIRVTGNSVVTANPDRVRIDVGVVTQSPQSQTAVSQNASRLQAVLAALRKSLGAGADIKTLSYSLNPEYQYHVSGGQPTISGYTATNVVRITLDDLGKIGTVIDTAAQAGANRLPSIQFALRDEQSVRAQAQKDAALKAQAEAGSLAATLGLKVNRILTVEDGGAAVVPMREVMFARAESAAAATPIQPGTIDVNATIVLTVEVSPK
jgi:uncharacterized protein YggE